MGEAGRAERETRLESSSRTIAAALPALAIGLTALVATRCLDDSDTWWHLAGGRWIAAHGTVPRTDPLSFTVPRHAWTNVQWLFDLSLYHLYESGAATLLVLTATLMFSLAATLLLVNLRRSLGPTLAALLTLWAVAVAQERFTVRPEMVSFVWLQVLLWLFASAPRNDGRCLWLLPVVMMAWANTHSLFIIGVLLIGCHLGATLLLHAPLPAAWRRGWDLSQLGRQRVLLWGSAGILATVVNPYGIEGALFPIELASRINGSNPAFAAINEFHSPFSGYEPSFALAAYQALLVFSVCVVGAALLLSLRSSQPEPHDAAPAGMNIAGLLFFLILVYLSVLARRNMALFALGAMPFVAACLGRIGAALPARWRAIVGHATVGLTLIAPAAIAFAGWAVVTNQFYRWDLATHEFGIGVQSETFPIEAAAFARDMHLPPRLYNDFTSGGYLSWDNPVGGGVYIDGRLEVYDADFFAHYLTGASDPQYWQDDADNAGVQTVIMDHRFDARGVLVRYLLQDARWALVYFDQMAVVFVRRAGNMELIERAASAFTRLDAERLRYLLSLQPRRQWPAADVQALWNYGNMVSMLGKADIATQCFTHLLSLDLPAPWEFQMRLRLAAGSEPSKARQHLQRAEQLSPGNPAVRKQIEKLGN